MRGCHQADAPEQAARRARDEFETYLRRSLEAFKLNASLEILRPRDASVATPAHLRRMLTENEASDRDTAPVYFDQGVLAGDWGAPHVSPTAAHDADRRKLLIMDVDRQ
jgi:hypothetical protein